MSGGAGATVLTTLEAGVARLTLNRPEVRNALSRTMLRELGEALAACEADPAARVVVLAGAGDQAFCAGADLRDVGERGTTLQARESFGGLGHVLESLARMRTPVLEYAKSLRYLREMLTLVALSDDAREGIRAFFERRDPEWTGR